MAGHRPTNKDSRKDYVFVSYSSKDKDVVFNKCIFPIMDQYGMNVYWDEDFSENAAESWTRQMAGNMSKAKACLCFLSNQYIQSYACLLEALYAFVGRKPIIPIMIDWKLEESSNTGYCSAISPKTLERFRKIRERLDKTRFSIDFEDFIDTIIEDGQVQYSDVSHYFIELQKQFDATKLDINDVEHIQTSLVNSLKKISEGIFAPENVSTLSNAASEQPRQQSSVSDTVEKNKRADHTESTQATEKPEKPSDAKPGEQGQKAGKVHSVTEDVSYTLYGNRYTDNQSDLMVNVFAKVLLRHEELLPELIETMSCLSAVDYTKEENRSDDMKSYFRGGEYLAIGDGVMVGTSLSVQEKAKQIAVLLKRCGEPLDVFVPQDGVIKEIVEKKYSSTDSQRRRGAEESYTIYGQEYSGNQSKMMIDALKALMERHFDQREELATLHCIKLADMDALKNNSFFRSGKSFQYQGVTYSIGTSFGREDKMKQIKKALLICGESADNFQIEGLGLTNGSASAGPAKNKGKRDFLNG